MFISSEYGRRQTAPRGHVALAEPLGALTAHKDPPAMTGSLGTHTVPQGGSKTIRTGGQEFLSGSAERQDLIRFL